MKCEYIHFSVEAGVAQLSLRRPKKRNAVTGDMWSAIIDGLAALADDAQVRVLAVSGTGGSFCAGADLRCVRDESGGESGEYRALAVAGLSAVRDFPRPTAAVIDGPCVGGGLLLAVACDVRFASSSSSFAIPAVRYGIEIDEEGLARVVELLGSGRASRFLLSAMTVSGKQAAAMGLVEHCGDDYFAEAEAYLRAAAAGQLATIASTRDAIRRAAAGSSPWSAPPTRERPPVPSNGGRP